MQRKVLAISIVLTVFLIAFISYLFFVNKEEINASEEDLLNTGDNGDIKLLLEECLAGGEAYPDYDYFACKAISKRDESICRVNDTRCLEIVLMAKAIDASDVEICGNIKTNNLKIICSAVASSDKNYCNLFEKEEDLELCIFFSENGQNPHKIEELINSLKENKNVDEKTEMFYRALLTQSDENCPKFDENLCHSLFLP